MTDGNRKDIGPGLWDDEIPYEASGFDGSDAFGGHQELRSLEPGLRINWWLWVLVVAIATAVHFLGGKSALKAIALISFVTVVQSVAHIAFVVMLGVRPTRVGLFCGPQLIRYVFPNRKIASLGAVPLFVTLGLGPDGSRHEDPRFPQWRIMASAAFATMISLVLACIMIGLLEGWRAMRDGILQWIEGAFSPLAIGQALIAKSISALRNGSVSTMIGLIAAKLCAYQCLPIGSLGTFAIYLPYKKLLGHSERAMDRFGMVWALVWFAVAGGWIIAIIAYCIPD